MFESWLWWKFIPFLAIQHPTGKIFANPVERLVVRVGLLPVCHAQPLWVIRNPFPPLLKKKGAPAAWH